MTNSPAPDHRIHHGDCVSLMRDLEEGSIDAIVTDPPYAIETAGPPSCDRSDDLGLLDDGLTAGQTTGGSSTAAMLGMQSQNWHETATHSRGYIDNDPDAFEAWTREWAVECLRVLKPGGHLIAFGGTPTWHRQATGIEKAGFVIRGSMAWIYATGFPKGLNVEAALNGSKSIGSSARQAPTAEPDELGLPGRRWAGWGTSLKPAHEPIVLARKPLIGTVARNVTTHGTGALNIDGCRINATPDEALPAERDRRPSTADQGRWPTDVFLNADAAAALDQKAAGRSVSEFFWHSKPGPEERVAIDGVSHPTVKPLALMRELIRLITPPGGTVLDPFAGSGTTVEAAALEGFRSVAIERESKYLPLIEQRLARRFDPVAAVRASGQDLGLFAALNDQAC